MVKMGQMGRIEKIGQMGLMVDMVWMDFVGWVQPTTKGKSAYDLSHSQKGRRNVMGRILNIGMISVMASGLFGSETLQQNCLKCHQEQQIPSDLIYKRYLMKYSTPERIEKAMFDYLKDPLQSRSIMPPQFFLKFPMKSPTLMDDKTLHREIHAYIKKFDIKKRLILDTSK